MFCPQCGATNDDNAQACSGCGLDLSNLKQQWSGPAGSSVDQARPATGGPAQPAPQAPAYQQPAYQQQPYQPAYQAPPYQTGSRGVIPQIPSYMGWAIAVLILCFWPTGIAAVVFASRVGNSLAVGDIAGAQEASRKAKMWCWITFGISIAWIVIAIIAIVVAGAASVTIN